jgi:Fe2+ or Zn2+ uptake regulation protein
LKGDVKMFQRVCNKCGKVIDNKDKYIELNTEAWQSGGTFWDEMLWLNNVHLCEKCSQDLIKWLGGNK